MMHQQRGYILFITFSMLALCTALISVSMAKALTHKKLTQTILDHQQMQQFALSTTALAQGFFSFPAPDEKQEKNNGTSESTGAPSSKQPDEDFAKKLLEKVLPVVNKTQTFMMKEIEKNFPVVIDITFFCEAGKININKLYDVANKKFYDEGVEGKDKKVFATWLFDKIAALTQKPSLLQPFIEHLQQRKISFNDVTQLLEIKEFAACFADAIFYDCKQQEKNVDKKNHKLFLTDIFTVASENDTIQPWLLSPSVCVLLDITQHNNKQQDSAKKEDKKIDLSSFKQQANWQKDWDTNLKPIYDIAFDKIPKQCAMMLSTQFEVSTFSIMTTVTRQLDDGEYNKTVRIYAILKEKKLPDSSITYDVIKIYQV